MVGSVLFHLACSGAIHKVTLWTYLKEKRNRKEYKSTSVFIDGQHYRQFLQHSSTHCPDQLPHTTWARRAPEGCFTVLSHFAALCLTFPWRFVLRDEKRVKIQSGSLPPFNTEAGILPKISLLMVWKILSALNDLYRPLCHHFFSLVRQKVMTETWFPDLVLISLFD